jgi:hypothetical protein
MISHKHKCIFVHIPKAAGTSIENMFLKDLGLDINNRHSLLLGLNNNENIGSPKVTHLLASEYVNCSFLSQELFEKYFKFAFVRNPYDRLFSSYSYRKYNQYMSFDTFILKKIPILLTHRNTAYFYRTQYDYLYEEGEVLVDFVGKFERLNEDIKVVLNKLDLNHFALEHLNKSKTDKNNLKQLLHIYLKKYFIDFNLLRYTISKKDNILSKKSKEFINEFYCKDFESFDYEFL